MYGRYIFEGNPNWISCTSDVAMAVFERLWPAFEDLFDEAEDHALSVLLVQWRELCQLEYQSFENVILQSDYLGVCVLWLWFPFLAAAFRNIG